MYLKLTVLLFGGLFWRLLLGGCFRLGLFLLFVVGIVILVIC